MTDTTTGDVGSIVRAFEDDFMAAFDRRDARGLAALFTERATIVTEWGDVVQGRDVFARGLARAFERISSTLTLVNTPTHAELIADDVIVAHGTSCKRERSTGAEERLAFTRVLVRRDGKWRLAANHVSEPSARADPRGSATEGR